MFYLSASFYVQNKIERVQSPMLLYTFVKYDIHNTIVCDNCLCFSNLDHQVDSLVVFMIDIFIIQKRISHSVINSCIEHKINCKNDVFVNKSLSILYRWFWCFCCWFFPHKRLQIPSHLMDILKYCICFLFN